MQTCASAARPFMPATLANVSDMSARYSTISARFGSTRSIFVPMLQKPGRPRRRDKWTCGLGHMRQITKVRLRPRLDGRRDRLNRSKVTHHVISHLTFVVPHSLDPMWYRILAEPKYYELVRNGFYGAKRTPTFHHHAPRNRCPKRALVPKCAWAVRGRDLSLALCAVLSRFYLPSNSRS